VDVTTELFAVACGDSYKWAFLWPCL